MAKCPVWGYWCQYRESMRAGVTPVLLTCLQPLAHRHTKQKLSKTPRLKGRWGGMVDIVFPAPKIHWIYYR